MTKLASWNIRGLNTSHKQREIRKFIAENHLSLICIVENKINGMIIARVKDNCLFNWELIHNGMVAVLAGFGLVGILIFCF